MTFPIYAAQCEIRIQTQGASDRKVSRVCCPYEERPTAQHPSHDRPARDPRVSADRTVGFTDIRRSWTYQLGIGGFSRSLQHRY